MKYLIVLGISLIISACATESAPPAQQPKQDTISDNEPMPSIEGAPEERSETKNEKKTESKALAAPPTATSMYSALRKAVESQNEENIQKASSDILALNAKDSQGLNALGLYHYKKGHLDAAQFLFNKGIAANPNSSELYGNLALVELAKGDRRDAIKTMRKALEINPQDGFAGANLGFIYVQEKDYLKAIFALEVPIKKGMKDYKIMNNYAIALVGNGKVKEAAEIYEKLLKENQSQREELLNNAITLIENMQKNKEGLDLLNRLKFVGAPQEARDTIKGLENKAKAGLQ